ncbi:MAG: EamA family transporter, partial [Deferribacterales bacterium]
MKDETKGFISAIIAYGLWGIFPIYWKFIHHVNSFEIVFHRIVWSFIFLVLILAIKKELKNSFAHIKDSSILKYFFMSSLMIGSNWFLYIWAVNNDNILETSLGYYMAPIFNVIFAKFFLKETLT